MPELVLDTGAGASAIADGRLRGRVGVRLRFLADGELRSHALRARIRNGRRGGLGGRDGLGALRH